MTDHDISRAAEIVDADISLVERASELSTKSGQDRLRAYGLGVLGMIPWIGSLLSEVASFEIPSARERRLDDLARRVAEGVATLADDIQEHLAAPPPDYSVIVETVLEDVIRASEDEKRQAYAAILLNALHMGDGDAEEPLLFVDLVERSRPLHLRLLSVLWSCTDVADRAASGLMGGSLMSTVKSRLEGYSDDMIRRGWGDLSDWGLLNTPASSLTATITASGAAVLTPRKNR